MNIATQNNIFKKICKKNSKLAEKKQALQVGIQEYIAKNKNIAAKQASIMTIPVVFHIVYNSTTQNISDAQIQSQLEVLNEDFRKQNSNSSNIPAEFAGLAADCEIEFCLASVAPDGSPTNGITRTATNYSNIGSATTSAGVSQIYYSNLGGKDAWNTQQYINIWVGELNDGLLGYATYPTLAAAGEDGIVMSYEYFGTIGTATAPYDGGRTLTHEMGHFLGLYHIWGTNANECVEDDSVTDTPIQSTPHYGCPSYPQTSCNNSAMFMNYMDYVDDACMSMFSEGQKERMRAAIYTFRFGLLSSSACGTPTIACPSINFAETTEDVCEGNDLNLPTETMQNAVDETTGDAAGQNTPTIYWFANSSLSPPYISTPAVHYGNKCWRDETRTLYAAVLCLETNSFIMVGTHKYSVYPLPQAPFIVKNDNECTYTVVPACLYDTVSPDNFIPLDLGTPAGSTELLVTAASSLNACNTETFLVEYPACEYIESECAIFESSNMNMTIETTSNFALVSELYVPKNGKITDVNVSNLDINHSFLADLDVVLESPDGMMTILFNNICGDQNDFNLILDDEAESATFPCPATNGMSYQPHGALAAFNGRDSQGTWKLHIVDYYAQDGGMLNSWSLEICTEASGETTTTKAHLKAFLEGAYNPNTNLMRTELLNKDLIPLTQPYDIEPWYYEGNEYVASHNDFPPNIVDWVLVEARSATNDEQVLDRKAAFVRNDGLIIDTDGSEGVGFNNLAAGEAYYIVVRHRNHLANMSSEAITLPNNTVYDFTNPNNVNDGLVQLADLEDNGFYALPAGDFDANGIVIVIDYNIFKSYVSLISVYVVGDCNMDGNVTVTDFNYYRPNISRIGLSEIRY